MSEIYRVRSEYTVVFISKHYARKLWANHELKSAQARAFQENREYILPAIFDDTEIEGITKTIAYIDLRNTNPDELAHTIEEKLATEGHRPTRQQRMSSTEIKHRALELVGGVRWALEEERYKKDRLIYDNGYQNAKTEEERSAAWNQRHIEMSDITRKLMDTYVNQYKSEILLLKDEMLLRTGPQGREKYIDMSYEHPTNPLGVEAVITDFEKLALALDAR